MTNLINHSALPNAAPILPQDTPLLQMPQDIFTQILTYLPGQEIGESALVCRQWNKTLEDNDVWRVLFYDRFSSVNTTPIQNFRNAYQAIYSNLTKGVYASDTFKGHRGTIYSLAIFEGKLFSGSDDCAIKAWDLKTGKCTATFAGTHSSVYSLACFDGKLFSASDDSTINIWDLKTGEWTATLTGHEDSICSLAVFDGTLFSASDDCTIKIWDLKTGKCTATLKGHKDSVCSPVVFDGMLFSGSSDETIKVWELKTGECKATLKGHRGSVSSLTVFNGKLFSASDDCTIKIWDLKTGECRATLTGHEESVLSLTVFDGKLFSASDDCTIKVWDLKTRECTLTLTGHEDSVCSLAVFDGKLFSGSSDFKIKMWDFTADDRTIFQEIAHSLESESRRAVAYARERFWRMPTTAKDAIYRKLYAICQPFAKEYTECGEDAFYDQNRQRSTRAQKAQAIREYLDDQPPKKNPLLLAHLGIKIEKEYSEKLNCRSDYLEKIGILSVEDLKLISSASPHFLKVDILEVEEDFRENKVKIEAERRMTDLTTLVGEISQVVEDKIEETNTCGVILYEAVCPWASFQQKLKAFQAKIIEKFHTAKSMVEAVHSKNYNGLAGELNALIEEFETIDRNHQISKLHAYVNQSGILTAWNNLRAQGVQNLCALPVSKQSLQKLFEMGE